MELTPRKWGWRSLVGSWGVYWAGLAAVTLGPFGVYVWKMSQQPAGHGNVSLSMGDAGIQLTALRDGASAFNATVGVVPFALWVTVPPLAMWALWLMLRPSRRPDDTLRSPSTRDALDDGAAGAWAQPDASDATRDAVLRRERAP